MILAKFCTDLLWILSLTMLKLDIVIGGPSSPSSICTFPHSFTFKYRLRLVHIYSGDATTTSLAGKMPLLVMMNVVIHKFYGVGSLVNALLRRSAGDRNLV